MLNASGFIVLPKIPRLSSALLLASHIAFAAAFAPTCAPHLPKFSTFTGLAPKPCPGSTAAADTIRAGIGTRKPALSMEGGGGQTQWALMRETFRGKWTGSTTWFGKVDKTSAGPIDWATPEIFMPESVYHISFSDDLTGEWRGSGLRSQLPSTDTEKVLVMTGPMTSKTTCLFPGGLGGQYSLEFSVADAKPGEVTSRRDVAHHPANEVNIFDDRARSMLISLYRAPPGGGPVVLESVVVAPFRDALAAAAPGPRSTYPSAEALLSSVEGWKGTQLTRVPEAWGEGKPDTFEGQVPKPVSLDPARYTSQEVCRTFIDNLIFAGPETITLGKPFELVYGAKISDKEFKELVVSYEADGAFASWKHAVYKAY